MNRLSKSVLPVAKFIQVNVGTKSYFWPTLMERIGTQTVQSK